MDRASQGQTAHCRGQSGGNEVYVFMQATKVSMEIQRKGTSRFYFLANLGAKIDQFLHNFLQALPDNRGISTDVDEDGTTFTLKIDGPNYKSRGKYICDADGVTTTCFLDYDGKERSALKHLKGDLSLMLRFSKLNYRRSRKIHQSASNSQRIRYHNF